MKQETKDQIALIGTAVLTTSLGIAVGWMVEAGTVLAIRMAVGDRILKKGEVALFTSIIAGAGAGAGLMAMHKTWPTMLKMHEEVLSLFPTDTEEVKSDD